MANTPNLNLAKPTVGGATNTWGNDLNSNFDIIDSAVHSVGLLASGAVPASGGTVTGALVVNGGVAANLTGNVTGNLTGTATSATSAASAGSAATATSAGFATSAGTAGSAATAGSATSATSAGSAGSATTAGSLATGRTIAFSGGDVAGTISAFDGSADLTGQALTISGGAVTNAKMAPAPTSTLKGNISSGSATPSDLTVAQVQTLLGIRQTATAYALVGGGSSTLVEAAGVSSIGRAAAGIFTVNLSPAMPDTNYIVEGSAAHTGLAGFMEDSNQARSTASFGIRIHDGSGAIDPHALSVRVTSIA